MALNGNSFAAKLHELEDEYRLLRLRIQQAQRLDSAQLRQALTSVLADCRKTSQSLARSVKEGRSPAVAALSGVQLDYMKRMEELGGGGHAAAAGCTVEASWDEAKRRILAAISHHAPDYES